MDPSPPRKPGRPRDLQLVERRCSQILETAGRVFAESGFRQADVQTIADRIGVGKGTIYRYFATKEELFLASVDHAMRQLLERVEDVSNRTDDPLVRVGATIEAYLAWFEERPEVVELLIQERAEFRERTSSYFAHGDHARESWRAVLEELMAQGRLRRMPVETVMDTIGDMLYGTIFSDAFSGRPRAGAAAAGRIMDVIMHGILPAADAEVFSNDKRGRS